MDVDYNPTGWEFVTSHFCRSRFTRGSSIIMMIIAGRYTILRGCKVWTPLMGIMLLVQPISTDVEISSSEEHETIKQLIKASLVCSQKDALEESIELLLEKVLHVAKDAVAKISNEANRCINILLAK
ncbi:unnamed protein product [Triticum turgidum subsp. durum]|uniref:Uncharacterized protein n=1 Tax=Triticum turgidum subsp. durum TaxID=4567 RepID=A0A9R1BIE4_TRITD|nr:unnamed protein product [Triticum turgidum subsp. durum]